MTLYKSQELEQAPIAVTDTHHTALTILDAVATKATVLGGSVIVLGQSLFGGMPKVGGGKSQLTLTGRVLH